VKGGFNMNNNLIVYYSRKGENYWGGKIISLQKGNTEIAAEFIKNAVGGDLFKIETVTPYSDDYTQCTKEVAKDLRAFARPELKNYVDSIDRYDTVFVGFPNFCGTMPMPVFTFLEHYNWKGKKVIPFCSNEGSGMGRSERELKRICPGAIVESGLPIRGCETSNSETQISDWAKRAVIA
jgi:flavodoxin